MSRGLYDITDIIGLITSQDYKDRMLGEYAELSLRLERLGTMLTRHDNGTLDFEPACPIDLLKNQADIMAQYKNILEERAIFEGIDLSIL